MREIVLLVIAVPVGLSIGAFAGLICSIWALSVYSVFGDESYKGAGWRVNPKHGPKKSRIRFLVSFGFLIPFHPLPWVAIFVPYMAYTLLTDKLNLSQIVMGWAFLIGLVAVQGKFMIDMLWPKAASAQSAAK